jgi:hypothetical protein
MQPISTSAVPSALQLPHPESGDEDDFGAALANGDPSSASDMSTEDEPSGAPPTGSGGRIAPNAFLATAPRNGAGSGTVSGANDGGASLDGLSGVSSPDLAGVVAATSPTTSSGADDGTSSDPSSVGGGGTASGAASGARAADTSDASPEDSAIDDSKYSSPEDLQKWAPLVDGLPPDQRQAAEKALNRPIAAAKMLQAGGDDAKKAQAYLDANPAIKTALDTAAHGGKVDGTISKHDISSFISTMQKQLSAANDTLSGYQKDNPNADGQSLELVRQAALLQANLPITNAADPSVQGKGDNATGLTTQSGLQAIVNANPGLSSALRGAANLFSQPGMFAALDQGGLDGVNLATHNPDQKFNQDNITGWVKNQSPTTGGSFASFISDAATRGAVSGIDTSNLNADIFTNPQNYSGAQKAAALVQLQTTQQQVEAGSSLRKTDDTDAALTQRIKQLQADPDVAAYLQQSMPTNESAIINSDPAIAAAMQKRYTENVVTGDGLKDDLDAVDNNNSDAKNPKESDAAAFEDFSSELMLDGDLRGGDVPSEAQVVAGNASLTSRLQSDYTRDFSNGGELRQLLAQKDAKPTDAMATTQADEQSFEGVLDPNFIESQSDQYSSTTSSLIQPALLNSGQSKDVLAALSNGTADPDEIADSVASSVDPATLTGGTSSSLSQNDTKALISAFLKDLQNGTSLQDALAKYDPTSKSFDPGAAGGQLSATLQADSNAAAEAHTLLENFAGSALLMQSQAGGDATDVGLAEGGEAGEDPNQKRMEKTSWGLLAPGMAATIASYAVKQKTGNVATVGKFAAAGEAFGVAGGGITAALTLPNIKEMIQSGQHWAAALSLGAGTRGAISATTGAYDLGAYGAKYLAQRGATAYASGGLSRLAAGGIARAAVGAVAGEAAGEAAGAAATEAVGAASGPAGLAIDVVLASAFIYTAIAQAVKKAHEKKAFDKTVDPTLDQYGITKPK